MLVPQGNCGPGGSFQPHHSLRSMPDTTLCIWTHHSPHTHGAVCWLLSICPWTHSLSPGREHLGFLPLPSKCCSWWLCCSEAVQLLVMLVPAPAGHGPPLVLDLGGFPIPGLLFNSSNLVVLKRAILHPRGHLAVSGDKLSQVRGMCYGHPLSKTRDAAQHPQCTGHPPEDDSALL